MASNDNQVSYTFNDDIEQQLFIKPQVDKYASAYIEAVAYNVYGQYNKLCYTINHHDFKTKYKYKKQLFKLGHKKILEYIIRCVKNDLDFGNFYSEENEAIMRQAGQYLWESGGEKAMHNKKIWRCIPQRYHREIDYFWSGIGTW